MIRSLIISMQLSSEQCSKFDKEELEFGTMS